MLTRQDTITALAPAPSTFTPHPTGQKYLGEGSVVRFVIKWGGIESEGGGREGEVTLLSRESKQCCYKHDSDTIKTSIQHTHTKYTHSIIHTAKRPILYIPIKKDVTCQPFMRQHTTDK